MDKSTKSALENGEMLPLMEAFYSIQGEGFFAGTAAYFLRIGGCDVGCHWCDVKESWDSTLHPPTLVTDILKDILVNNEKLGITVPIGLNVEHIMSYNFQYSINMLQQLSKIYREFCIKTSLYD